MEGQQRPDYRVIDWDDETVGRLLEWLYADDYSSPDPGVTQVIPSPTSQHRTAKSGSPDPQDEQQPRQTSSGSSDSATNSDDGFTIMNVSEKPKAENSNRPLTPVMSLQFPNPDTKPKYCSAETFTAWKETCQPRSNTLTYEVTLLCHAKLYALADYMILADLQAQAFRRLQNTLDFINNFEALTPVVNDLVKLVRYIYANTSRP